MPVAFSLTLLQTMSYRRLLPLALSFVLAGCSTIQNIFDPLSLGADSSAAFVLTAKGVQQFQCTADANGRYWKFITPQAELTDGKGRVVARQGSEGSFFAKDGSILAAKIEKHADKATPGNLRDLVYRTTARQGRHAHRDHSRQAHRRQRRRTAHALFAVSIGGHAQSALHGDLHLLSQPLTKS